MDELKAKEAEQTKALSQEQKAKQMVNAPGKEDTGEIHNDGDKKGKGQREMSK